MALTQTQLIKNMAPGGNRTVFMELLQLSRVSLQLPQPVDHLFEDQALQSSATVRLRFLLQLKL